MDEREGRIGYWVSGVAHGSLILWAILGGALFRPQPSPMVRTTQVSTISGAEFEAMAAAARGAGPVGADATAVATLPDPVDPAEDGAARPVDAIPPQSGQAAALEQPDTAETVPDLSDFAPAAPVDVATDLPVPPPNQTDIAETAPQIPDTPPAPVAEAQPDQPTLPVPDAAAVPVAPRSVLALDASRRPQDRPADLVAAFNRRVADAGAAEAARQAAADAAAAAARQATADAAAEAAAEAERQAAATAAAEAERQAAAEAAERDAAADAAEAERQAAADAAAEAERQAAADAAAEADRQAADAAAEADREAAAAEAERRAAADAAEAEREAAAEAERQAATEAAAEAERQAAAEAAAEEERRAAAEAAAEEERRAAAEAAAEEERRAAAEAAAEEERRAEAERQAAAAEAERQAAAEAAAEAERQAAAEQAAREAADRQALEDALRDAQGGAGGQDTASGSDTAGSPSQTIEGGSGASAGLDPLAAALAGAMAGTGAAANPANDPSGPPADMMQLTPSPIQATPLPDAAQGLPMGDPLTLSERDGLRFAIQDCWNLGALSVEASQMTVSVGFTLSPDGVPDQNSMRIAGYQGGSESAAQQGFEVARRAILMCGRAGFDLPASKYGRWRDVVVDFRPDGVAFQ